MPALSVILTTYKKPQDLVRVLEGFRSQTFSDFEVLVCDDGSGDATRDAIKLFADTVPFRVEHCWQEDSGFRAAASRNLGVRAATSETLVFTDGDCVPFPDFLEHHASAQDATAFQAGERYLLSLEEANGIGIPEIESGAAFASPPAREVKRVKRVRRNDRFYRLVGIKPERPRLMTCNCSVPRQRVLEINGLDENYEGWGMEDEDLRRRLVAQGAKPSSLIGVANCLHLWHQADETFLGKRKQSPNWRYYARGFHLSRARRGLTERPLSEVRARFSGPEPLVALAQATLGFAKATQDGPCEVEVLVGHVRPSSSGKAEITVALCASLPLAAKGVDLLCAPGLEVAGGELPAEVHPELDPRWAQQGVRATRPLPSSGAEPLGQGALEAAKRILEAIL
ncbi:MAG: glycosyltransferase [Planctomycetes bacterium]|nr:glycosyltransferase [Planctomycetota bacterium]